MVECDSEILDDVRLGEILSSWRSKIQLKLNRKGIGEHELIRTPSFAARDLRMTYSTIVELDGGFTRKK